MHSLRRVLLSGYLIATCGATATIFLVIGTRTTAVASTPAPTGVTAAVSGNTVQLQWTAPSGPVTSYVIEVGSLSTFALIPEGTYHLATFDTQSTATSAVFTGVPARNYWVQVRARNGAELSDPSSVIRVVVTTGVCYDTLFAPEWSVSGRESSVTITPSDREFGCPPTAYIIEVGSTRGAADLLNLRTPSAASSYEATNVLPGTYYVRLRAVNDTTIGFPSEERIVVVGSGPCVYAVSPSALSISRAGLNGALSIEADPNCSWSVSGDASWLLPPGGVLPVSGQGNRSFALPLNPNFGPARQATITVRWPGGGVDVPVTQNGFGS